jgi:hypothetical protein
MEENMDDLDEVESILDEDGKYDNAKYKLRQRLEWSVIDVVVDEHPNIPGHVDVIFRRGYLTMENPQFDGFSYIKNPEELLAIAKMALLAREHFLRLEAAGRKLEQAGQPPS